MSFLTEALYVAITLLITALIYRFFDIWGLIAVGAIGVAADFAHRKIKGRPIKPYKRKYF